MTEPTTPGNSYEPPLVPPTYSGPSMPDIADLVEGSRGRKDAPSGGSGLGRNVLVGGIDGVLVNAGGAFFAGRAMAAGPATLADALTAAQAGTLPCGTSDSGAGAFIGRLCGTGAGGAPSEIPGGATGSGGAAGGGFGGGGFGRGLSGDVTAVTATSITVNTRAGSVTVAVPSTVTVAKTVDGTMSDVVVGSTVTVTSTTDASGNRTASRITLVPAGQLPGGGSPGNG